MRGRRFKVILAPSGNWVIQDRIKGIVLISRIPFTSFADAKWWSDRLNETHEMGRKIGKEEKK